MEPSVSISIRAHAFAATGQMRRAAYSVADTAKPLKVTLAYTDAPGPTSGNAFVNDLDLVVNADGQTYKGNVLSGGQSVPGGTADPRNNVENVFLPPGVTGRFSVDVRGTNIPGDGVPGNADTTDQDYALVVSNANPANGPVLVHDLSTPTEIGDGDGKIEPGEQFRLKERLRNLGTSTASGSPRCLSGPPRTTVPASSSAYPNIPSNATGTNTTPFRVRLANNFVCGDPVELTLNLTTAQGNGVFGISVPTGGPGTPTDRNSTDVPKSIPDNNPAGVTSNLVRERRRDGPGSRRQDLEPHPHVRRRPGDLADRAGLHQRRTLLQPWRRRRQLHQHGLRRRGGHGDRCRSSSVQRLVPARTSRSRRWTASPPPAPGS